MITRLDHIVLICRDFNRAVSDYSKIFNCGPLWHSSGGDFETALFKVSNTALEIVAPSTGSAAAPRIEALLGEKQGKLTSLAFQANDIENAHHILSRRGLKPSDISSQSTQDISSMAKRSWRSFRCPDEVCGGIKTFVLHTSEPPQQTRSAAIDGGVSSLDHVVIHTPNPERSTAHYGARLGLRLALDRTIEAFKTRFLFFRVGGLRLEIIHRLDQSSNPDDLDEIWGLTWAVNDLQHTHERLSSLGLDLSPIRTGRKPGSRVFTLRNGTADIPTLFIAHAPKDKR